MRGLAFLLFLGFAGCDTTCEAQEEQFIIDESLTEEDITVMVERWGLSDSSLLECEDVCQHLYEETTGWYTTAVGDCTMSADDSGGEIACEGDGVEDTCL